MFLGCSDGWQWDPTAEETNSFFKTHEWSVPPMLVNWTMAPFRPRLRMDIDIALVRSDLIISHEITQYVCVWKEAPPG